jgi:NADH:ubiquinone oxidoreductase subunit C
LLPDATVIRSVFDAAGVTSEVEESSLGRIAHVPLDRAAAALRALRDSDLDFSMLVDLFGTDTTEEIQITYHLRSFARDEEVYVRTSIAYDGELPSVWEVYAAALMPEREVAELFGLVLLDHPNPKRLFTTEGVEPLLRKSVPIRTAEEVRAR